MKRIETIRARVINTANRETQVGSDMRIPGMKIGTRMSAGGPTFEDINWLIDLAERAVKFIETAHYVKEEDMLVAQRFVSEIGEQG